MCSYLLDDPPADELPAGFLLFFAPVPEDEPLFGLELLFVLAPEDELVFGFEDFFTPDPGGFPDGTGPSLDDPTGDSSVISTPLLSNLSAAEGAAAAVCAGV